MFTKNQPFVKLAKSKLPSDDGLLVTGRNAPWGVMGNHIEIPSSFCHVDKNLQYRFSNKEGEQHEKERRSVCRTVPFRLESI